MTPKIYKAGGAARIELYGELGRPPKNVSAKSLRAHLRMMNAVDDGSSLLLYGDIDSLYGIDPVQVNRDLEALGDVTALTVYVNSPGGNVFDGMALYAILQRHPATKTVCIDGLAASAASFLAMVGDTIKIAAGGSMMVHNASGVCVGESAEMREVADVLDRITDVIASVYSARTAKPMSTIKDWMAAETWFNAAEAVAAGLADSVIPFKGKTGASNVAARLRQLKSHQQQMDRTPTGIAARLKQIAKD